MEIMLFAITSIAKHEPAKCNSQLLQWSIKTQTTSLNDRLLTKSGLQKRLDCSNIQNTWKTISPDSRYWLLISKCKFRNWINVVWFFHGLWEQTSLIKYLEISVKCLQLSVVKIVQIVPRASEIKQNKNYPISAKTKKNNYYMRNLNRTLKHNTKQLIVQSVTMLALASLIRSIKCIHNNKSLQGRFQNNCSQ